MKKLLIFFILIKISGNVIAEPFINNDLAKSLAELYEFNPKINYEREILK